MLHHWNHIKDIYILETGCQVLETITALKVLNIISLNSFKIIKDRFKKRKRSRQSLFRNIQVQD